MSTRPREARAAETRRRWYLIVLAGIVVLLLVSVGLNFVNGAPPAMIVSYEETGELAQGEFRVEVESQIETEKTKGKQPRRISVKENAGQIALGDGSSENAEAYVKRMLAALSVDARLVRIFHSTSSITPQNRWIARYDALLLQTETGQLDAVHLVTFRELDRDKITPYLLRADNGAQHIFRVSLEATTVESRLSVPFLKFLLPGEPAIELQFESDLSIDQGALLGEFAARGFVSVTQ